MKKILALMLACTAVLCTIACGAANSTKEIPEFSNASEAIDQIYKEKSVDLPLETISINLEDEFSVSSYMGLSLEDVQNLDFAAASESKMGSHPYSLVIAKAKDASKTDDIAQKVAQNIDTRKWICVEADDMTVVTSGPYIMLFMVGSDLNDLVTSKDMTAAFEKVFGSIDKKYTK